MGMSYSGQPSAHVGNAKTKVFGASKRVELSMTANNQTSNRKSNYAQSAWTVVKNEEEKGQHPYPGGHQEVGEDFIYRKRNKLREEQISLVPFVSNVKAATVEDVKL